MNIVDLWPHVLPEELNQPGIRAFFVMLNLRRETYQGFARIEEGKGILRPEMSFSTTYGQEAFRVLFARAIEEMLEAKSSRTKEHQLEELIDSINYVWSLLILDPKGFPQAAIADRLNDAVMEPLGYRREMGFANSIDCSMLEVIHAAEPVLEALRNRPWMNNAQSQYFDGWPPLIDFVCTHLRECFRYFEGWQQFVQFYLAKDNVLQFRLRSRY